MLHSNWRGELIFGSAVGGLKGAFLRGVLDEVNHKHDTRYVLGSQLIGGAQGAWLLHDAADGSLAVLKTSFASDRLEPLKRAARAVARARARGYPTPVWLAYGMTSSGVLYQVQEYAQGRPAGALSVRTVALLVDVLEFQTDLDPCPARNHSAHVVALLEHANKRVRDGRDESGLVDHYLQLVALSGSVTLPVSDLVHGDFQPSNVLLDEGRVTAVVDMDQVGSGTRAIDYAGLYRAAHLRNTDARGLRMIKAHAQAVAGPEVFTFCVAATTLGMIEWMTQYEPYEIPAVASRLHDLADTLDPRSPR